MFDPGRTLGWLALVGLVTVMGSTASVRAQSPTEVDNLEEDARLRFELASRAYERGDFHQAAEDFRESYRLAQRPQLLFNAYVAYRDATELGPAAEMLRLYLDRPRSRPLRHG